MIEPNIRTRYGSACLNSLSTMRRARLERREDPEKVLRGINVVFLVLFSLPVIESQQKAASAVLTSAHRSGVTIFPFGSALGHFAVQRFSNKPHSRRRNSDVSYFESVAVPSFGTPAGFRRVLPPVFSCLCLRSFPAALQQRSCPSWIKGEGGRLCNFSRLRRSGSKTSR